VLLLLRGPFIVIGLLKNSRIILVEEPITSEKENKKNRLRKKDKKNELVCPECGSHNIVRDPTRGELICADCGLVLTDKLIDSGAEWRAFTQEETNKRSRVGLPLTPLIHNKGLSTLIDSSNKDAYGRPIASRKRAQMVRMRRMHIRSQLQSSVARNLSAALRELERLASQLGIPRSVREEAATIYRKIITERVIRGRSTDAMIAATLYLACRLRKIPRTLGEIAAKSKATRKDISRCYRLILRKQETQVPIQNAMDYVSRFGTELGLSGKTINLAIDILRRAQEARITAGKDPTGLAAAAIYIAGLITGERRTQKSVADIAGVTEVTVRNRYKDLVKKLQIKI